MEWSSSIESPQTDEEDIVSKMAATDIKESMEKSKEFWGDSDFEDITIIPANLLKCPPNEDENSVSVASDLAHTAWETMSQNDFEEIAKINKDLLSNGEIAANNLVPTIESILRKAFDSSKIKLALNTIDPDNERQAIILVANQLLYIFDENMPPRIVDDDLDVNPNNKSTSPNNVNKNISGNKNNSTAYKDIKTRIDDLLEIAVQYGLGEIKVPKDIYANDRAKLAILERQIRGRLRLKQIIESGARNTSNKTTGDDLSKNKTILPNSNQLKAHKKFDLNKRLKYARAMREKLRAQSNIANRGGDKVLDKEENRQVNLPSHSTNNVFKTDMASTSQNKVLMSSPDAIETGDEEMEKMFETENNQNNESSPQFIAEEYDTASTPEANLSSKDLPETKDSSTSCNEEPSATMIVENSFKTIEELNKELPYSTFQQLLNLKQKSTCEYSGNELNLKAQSLQGVLSTSSGINDSKVDIISSSSCLCCGKDISIQQDNTLIKSVKHKEKCKRSNNLSVRSKQEMANDTTSKELLETMYESSLKQNEIQRTKVSLDSSDLERRNSGDTETIGTELSSADGNSLMNSSGSIKNVGSCQLEYLTANYSAAGDLPSSRDEDQSQDNERNIGERTDETLMASYNNIDNSRDLRIILRDTMMKVHEKTKFYLSRCSTETPTSNETAKTISSVESNSESNENDIITKISSQLLSVVNEINVCVDEVDKIDQGIEKSTDLLNNFENNIEQISSLCLKREASNVSNGGNKRVGDNNIVDGSQQNCAEEDHSDIKLLCDNFLDVVQEEFDRQKRQSGAENNYNSSSSKLLCGDDNNLQVNGLSNADYEKYLAFGMDIDGFLERNIFEKVAEIQRFRGHLYETVAEANAVGDETTDDGNGREFEQKIQAESTIKENDHKDENNVTYREESEELKFWTEKLKEIESEKKEFINQNIKQEEMYSMSSSSGSIEERPSDDDGGDDDEEDKVLNEIQQSNSRELTEEEESGDEDIEVDNEVSDNEVEIDNEETEENEEDDVDEDEEEEDESATTAEISERSNSPPERGQIESNERPELGENLPVLENIVKENTKEAEDNTDAKGKKRGNSRGGDNSLLYITIFVGVFTATYFSEYGRQLFSNAVVGNLKSNAISCLDRAITAMTTLKTKLQNS